MFTFQTATCAMLKNVVPIVKNEIVSLRAKNQIITFCLYNRLTGLLFLHRVKAHVEKETEFGIGSDRLLTLLQRETLTLSYDGSSVHYKSGRSSGSLETHKPAFEEWPSLKTDGVPVQGILEEFSFLDLKSKTSEIFLFGGTSKGKPVVAAGDREHAVYINLPESSTFSLPLTSASNARRIFKGSVNVIVKEGVVFFTSKTDVSQSVLRSGQIDDTKPLSLETFSNFKAMPNAWSTKINAEILNIILKDYKVIADKDRVGLINLVVEPTSITLSTKTRHGEAKSVEQAHGDKGEVILNAELLDDICRLEGVVTIGLKENKMIFFIENSKATFFCGLGG